LRRTLVDHGVTGSPYPPGREVLSVIKYIGSKRVLVPVLGQMASAVGPRTALDLFTGTTRVAQEFKRRGIHVTTVDTAAYSDILSKCYIETDASTVDLAHLEAILGELMAIPGKEGYFTRVFCEESRYFQPKNGMRVDAIREELEKSYRNSPLFPILLTSLMLAADRVDSTTGVQMAYLKQWAPRAYEDLDLKVPALLKGTGTSLLGDATRLVSEIPRVDLAYLDPPYNQHSYRGNYHIWETLVRWDAPDHYGVACKRVDIRDPETKSVFNFKKQMPIAMVDVISRVNAEVVMVSYNDESWITAEQMMDSLEKAGFPDVRMLAFDHKRYVGAQIGIYNPSGHLVGEVSHLRNTEYIFVAGPSDKVQAAVDAARQVKPPKPDTLF
jgi:adenine-specific DNA-methyltransferase